MMQFPLHSMKETLSGDKQMNQVVQVLGFYSYENVHCDLGCECL